jgi:hypothetical protein
MSRRSCLVLLTVIIAASVWTDLAACGDKFLRVGRSARFRRYASVHPSSVLVYAPRWTHHGISEFELMLKRAGHKPITVTTVDAMSQAFVGAKYDLVIASYPDSSDVAKHIEALPVKPAFLPILYKATKAEEAEADAAYRCQLRPETMTPFQALEEIDHLIDLRLKDTAAATPGR